MALVLEMLEVCTRTCIFLVPLDAWTQGFNPNDSKLIYWLLLIGRLIRLVPEDTEDVELIAIKSLLNYRLPPSNDEARFEWLAIVEGTHGLWKHVSSPAVKLNKGSNLLLRYRPKNVNFSAHSSSS